MAKKDKRKISRKSSTRFKLKTVRTKRGKKVKRWVLKRGK